WVDADLNGLR
nr:RecName: Full=Unknown protein 3 [Pinus halepensis]